MADSDLTAARLRELLIYDPATGLFTRRCDRQRAWKAGREAGSKGRYVVVTIDGVRFQAHRLAWLYMTGKWPVGDLDHIDRDKRNNRWRNLREASKALNQFNQVKAPSNNRLGVRGVCQTAYGFMASITVDGKKRFLGRFPSPGEAEQAYLNAKKKIQPEALLVP